MTREEALTEWVIPAIRRTWNEKKCDEILKALEQEPCIQEKQANADKIDAVYIDGFKAGYSQARFDLEQEPCDAVSRDSVLNTLENMDKALDTQRTIESYKELLVECMKELPSVHPKSIECEDVISRKLLKASLVFDNKTSNMQVAEMRKIFEIIDALPSVHPECTEDCCPAAFKSTECEDCISRDALCKWINNKTFGDIVVASEHRFSELPSVQPKQRTGQWNDTGSGQECSECGEIQYGYDSFRKYCANCGVKMQEVDE